MRLWRRALSYHSRVPQYSSDSYLEPLSMSLCQILWKFLPGDLAHQAANASSALTGNSVSIPSSNLAPTTRNPIRFRPPFSGLQRSLSLSATTCFRRRHLEHKVQRAVSTRHPLRHICPQPHCAEHRLQRVPSPKMHLAFRWEVVEAHERVPVPNHRLSGIDATSRRSGQPRTRLAASRTPTAWEQRTSPATCASPPQ